MDLGSDEVLGTLGTEENDRWNALITQSGKDPAANEAAGPS
jgi:hypothetical protein